MLAAGRGAARAAAIAGRDEVGRSDGRWAALARSAEPPRALGGVLNDFPSSLPRGGALNEFSSSLRACAPGRALVLPALPARAAQADARGR